MLTLDRVQQAMIQAIDHGPGFMPPGLFAGSDGRALMGLKVHANTISHARLVALEDTFPRTRGMLGQEHFNALSRDYVELPSAQALPLGRIGAGFADFLTACEDCDGAADLARFEWSWLESYHAADMEPLRLAGLVGIEPDDLLRLGVSVHPAARIMALGSAVREALAAEAPGLAGADAVLIVRPDAEVLLHPASRLMCAILRLAGRPIAIGNLMAVSDEPASTDHPSPEVAMQALVALLDAGALQKAD